MEAEGLRELGKSGLNLEDPRYNLILTGKLVSLDSSSFICVNLIVFSCKLILCNLFIKRFIKGWLVVGVKLIL